MDAYDRTIDRLQSLDARRDWDLKLESVRAVLARMGDPESRVPAVHVAGTNGKGSTAATAASVLVASGRRTGLYTSPHLVDFRERVRIDGERIPRVAVVALTEEIEHEALAAAVTLSFFELATILAIVWFARSAVDVAVVEVGLGGRLDATNVVHSRVSAITTIAFDHERFLGDTLAAIAAEKAGIVRPGVPLVVGRLPPDALAVVTAKATAAGAPLRRLGEDFSVDLAGEVMTYSGARRIPGIRPALAGRHQIDNAAIALAALEAGGLLDGVDDAAIRRGVERVRWPGRFERIGRAPEVVLDGAHNPEGARALGAALRAEGDRRRVRLLFGVLADKRWPEMVAELAPLATEIAVVPVAERRSTDPATVAAAIPHPRVRVAPSVGEALDAWLDDPDGRDARILVAGSLFVVGEARARLVARGLAEDD